MVIKFYFPAFLLIAFTFVSCGEFQDSKYLVKNVAEFEAAVKNIQPGESIVLANGVWEDAELLFEANGTEEKPILLRAETKGKVSFEKASNLRIAGNYLVVEGLVFKNGYTPTTEVISFKKDKGTYSNHSRLTECVIDNYNQPERHEADTWVAIYGKHNRVDHNHLEGKRNRGVTLTVRLNSEESQENFHLIDHNYFGQRQRLGSNGGETLRIGTSHYSLTNSDTTVKDNFFEHCSGELEIISNKSGSNTYKNNVFFECEGVLTMRHGNKTLVDGNVFIGNNKPSTGGIRVINGQQTVTNNYGEGLTGYRLRGAFVIMNGVPNSPINRYFQVEDAVVKNNSFINCNHIELASGSDSERSAVPINSIVADNIFYNENTTNSFSVYDDISGIDFKNNFISKNDKTPYRSGFINQKIEFKRNENGLLVPLDSNINAGANISDSLIIKERTGVDWYSKEGTDVALNSGKVISVPSGLNTIFDAVKRSKAGDIIQLEANAKYTLTKTIEINHPISIRSTSDKKPIIFFEKKSLISINNGGLLSMQGVIVDGAECPDRTGNSVISTSKYSMNKNYKLFIEDCVFQNLDVNHSFDVVRTYKNTFADTISIQNSIFNVISGSVLTLDNEIEDIGIYNAEYVILKNNYINDIGKAALVLYRGGKDESTFGPVLEMDHNTFNNVGFDKRNSYGRAISLHGVQVIDIKNNIFNKTKGLDMHLVVGEPVVNISNNNVFETEPFNITGDQKYVIENTWAFDPLFKQEGHILSDNSPLKSKGTDKLDLGYQRIESGRNNIN